MISVILPAYNEENRILPTIKAIVEELSKNNRIFEVIVVDDGSTDKTKEVVLGYNSPYIRLLSYNKNRGKGGAVKHGIMNAKGDFVVFTDADLPYPPENIVKACELLRTGVDVVFGKREQPQEGKKYPFYRVVMSKCFSFFVRKMLDIKEKDTQCGFKAFTKKAAEQIFNQVTLTGWGFDVETIFLAEKLGYTIKRIRVVLTHENSGSKVSVFRDTARMIKEVISVKKKFKKGLYDL